MGKHTKRLVSLVSAIALLITCGISGLVLPAAAEPATNLFPNGDFEGFGEATPVTVPWAAYEASQNPTKCLVKEGVGVDGSWGMQTGEDTGSAYVTFTSATAPKFEYGKIYRFSFMAKGATQVGTSNTNGAYVQVYKPDQGATTGATYLNATSNTIRLRPGKTVDEWITYAMYFTPTEKDITWDRSYSLLTSRPAAETGTITYDNFVLEEVTDATDYVIDNDFENGFARPFYEMISGGKAEVVTKATTENANNKALKLTATDDGWDSAWMKNIHLEKNATYKVSFDYIGGAFRTIVSSSHGSIDGGTEAVFAAADTWTHGEYELNFTGDQNWAVCFEKRKVYNHNLADTFIDNITIKKVVEEPVATGIKLDKETAELEVGEDVTLTVTAQPDGATMPSIAWTSSDDTVATVVDGKVTAIKAGTTTITATAEGLTPVTCAVTVTEPFVDPNLIVNGDFEQGASVSWGDSAYVVEGAGKDGSFGFKTETTTAEGDSAKQPGAYYKGDFNGILEPYTTYVFSFDYKHEGKGFGQLDVVYGGTDWTGWGDTNLDSNVDWTTKTIEFTTGATENMNVRKNWEWQIRMVHYANAEHYGSATFQVDNFRLEKKVVIEATDIELDKTTAELEIGDEETLTVTAKPDGATMPTITWTSSDDTVATVVDGKVTAIKAGTTTITATAEGLTPVTCAVTVNAAALFPNGDFEGFAKDPQVTAPWTGVASSVKNGVGKDGSWGLEVVAGSGTIYPKFGTAPTFEEGATYRFSFEAKGSTTSDESYVGFYNYDNLTIIDNGGLSRAYLSAGETVDTWKTYSFEFKAGKNAKIDAGWGIPIVRNANETGSLFFDNFKIEKIGDAVKAEQIELNKAEVELYEGEDETLTVTVKPDGAVAPAIVWTSSDDTVATVVDGKVTAIKEGTTTITATAEGLEAVTCVVTVKKPLPATAIAIDRATASLKVGSSVLLSIVTTPENADKPVVVWSSSEDTVATVVDGVVKGIKEGTATITATVDGLAPATCEVTVTEAVDDGNLLSNGDFELGDTGWNKDAAASIGAGYGKDGSTGLKVEVTVPEGGESVWPGAYYAPAFNDTLKENTTYVLSFDYKHEGPGFGKFDVVHGGTDWTGWEDKSNLTKTEWTTYTITFTTGVKANMNVKKGYEWKVSHTQYASTPGTGATYFDNFKLVEMPKATAIKLDKASVKVFEGKTFTLSVLTEPEVATKPAITWMSSDATVATVVDGVITGVKKGTATITAAAEGLAPVTCEVVVAEDDGNMIVNGDFEQGAAVGWGSSQTEKDRIQEGVGKDGSTGLKMETKVDESTTAHQYAGIYYQEDFVALLEPDTIYTFSIDVKHEGAGSAQLYLNRNIGKLENGTAFDGGVSLGSGDFDWTTKTFTFSTPAVLPEAHKRFEWQIRQMQYKDKQGEGVAYFDNVKLVEVGKVVHADKIQLSPAVLDILPFDSSALAVTTTPQGATAGILTWESSDPTTVSVDETGKVVALKEKGSVTITVTNDKGKTATAKVNISEYGNLIKNGDFEQGASVNWGNLANVKPGIGKDGSFGIELTHESGNWTSYYYKGSFVGLMEPATTYEFSFDYYAPAKNSSIRFWSGQMNLAAGAIEKGGNPAVWKTAKAIFKTPTDLSFNTGWDMSIVCEETGNNPIILDNLCIKKYNSGINADTVTLSQSAITMIPGRTAAVTMHAQPVEADLNDIVWTSSDENVATVEYGVITGVGKGVATITGTTKNKKSASCIVTVNGNELLVSNGSFDVKGEENKWTFANGAAIAAGEGRVKSNAAMLMKDSSFSQTFKGLEAGTNYQIIFRYRCTKGQINVKLTNGEQVILDQTPDAKSLWSTATYEFTTPETLGEDSVLTFTGIGDGPNYIDNVLIAVKASLIDFTVEDIIWDGGGQQVVPGTELLFAVTVVNMGEDPVNIGETIYVDLRMNGQTFMTLEQECTSKLETNGRIIIMAKDVWEAQKGDHVISAVANPQLSILELDDSNNSYQVHLRVNENILEAPKPAKDAGMEDLTFVDEFDSDSTIDKYATGKDGYKWYVTRQWNAGTVTPNDYTVKDGIIRLHDNNPVFNITLSTMDINTKVGWTYNLGYLETRLRIVEPNLHEYMPGMSGGIPAIWSFAYQKWLNDGTYKHHVEIDWLEYWGRDLEKWPQYPDGYYTVTLHDQSNPNFTEEFGDDVWFSNSNSYCNGLGDGEWHVMGWLWVQDAIIAYIDGEEVFRIQYDENGEPSCKVNAHDKLIFDFTSVFSNCNVQDVVLYIAGAYDKPLELDYVRIWQGGTGSIDLPEIGDDENEEGDGVVIDIPAEEFWYNFCTDDWGDNIFEVTYDNYLNVLGMDLGDGTYEAEYYWSKLSDERKAEINALLAANGQPTYDELLAAALAMAEKVANGWLPPEEGGEGEDSSTPEDPTPEDQTPEDQTPEQDLPEDVTSESDEPEDVTSESDEPEDITSDSDEPEEGVNPEGNAPTGATTALPIALAAAMLLSAAVLWFVRKRDRA